MHLYVSQMNKYICLDNDILLFTSQFKMAPNPFLSMLTECKLNLENFKDWKRNLLMVLAVEKHKYVLDTPRPQRPKEDDPDLTSAYNKWMESDEIARIYMMASMPKNLQMQHEAYKKLQRSWKT